MKLARLLKLIKLATSPAVKEMIPERLFTIVSMLFKIMYVAHFAACFWFWLSGETADQRVVNDDGTVFFVLNSFLQS